MRINEAKLRETIKRLLIESDDLISDPDAMIKMEDVLRRIPNSLKASKQGNVVVVHSRQLYDSYMTNVASALVGAGGTQFGQNFESILSQAATQLKVFGNKACVDLNEGQAGDFEFADVATLANLEIGKVGILYSVKNSSKPQAPTGEITPKQFQKGVLGATGVIQEAQWFAPGFISSFMDRKTTEDIGMLGIGFVVDIFIPDVGNGSPIAAANRQPFPATDEIPHLFAVENNKYYPYSKLQSQFYYNFLNARVKANTESSVKSAIYDLPKPGAAVDQKTISEFNDKLIDNYIENYALVPMPVPAKNNKAFTYDSDGNIIKKVGQKKIFVVKEYKGNIPRDISVLPGNKKYTFEFMDKKAFTSFIKEEKEDKPRYTKSSQLLTITRTRKPFPQEKLSTDAAQYLGNPAVQGPAGSARAMANTIAGQFPPTYQNMLTLNPPEEPDPTKQGYKEERVFIAITPFPPSMYTQIKADKESSFNLVKYQVAKLLALATKQEIRVKSALANDAQIYDNNLKKYIAVPSSYMKPSAATSDPKERIEKSLTTKPSKVNKERFSDLDVPEKYIYAQHHLDYLDIMQQVLKKYSVPGSEEEGQEVARTLQEFLGITSIINENFPTISRADMIMVLDEIEERIKELKNSLQPSKSPDESNESRLRGKILEQISINRPLFDELLVTIKEFFRALLANVEDPNLAVTYLNNLNAILSDGVTMIKEKQSGQVASGPSLDSININTQDDNMPDNVENLFGPQNQQALPQQNVKSVAEAKLYESILRKLLAASKKRR